MITPKQNSSIFQSWKKHLEICSNTLPVRNTILLNSQFIITLLISMGTTSLNVAPVKMSTAAVFQKYLKQTQMKTFIITILPFKKLRVLNKTLETSYLKLSGIT